MKISTYLEEMCTNPYISLFFHDGRVDVLDSDGEYVDYICYQEDFETDDELIRELRNLLVMRTSVKQMPKQWRF